MYNPHLVVKLGRYLPYFCIGEMICRKKKNCQGTKGIECNQAMLSGLNGPGLGNEAAGRELVRFPNPKAGVREVGFAFTSLISPTVWNLKKLINHTTF